MEPTIIVAALSLAGTFLGTFSGMQLIKYRLDKQEEKAVSKEELLLVANKVDDLDKKVDKHNKLIERTYILEGDVKAIKEDIKELKNAG